METLELESRIAEMKKKKSLDELNIKLEAAEERTSKLEDTAIKIIQPEEQRENN